MKRKKPIKKYTLAEIDEAWTEYRLGFCFKYLINGEWKHSTLKPESEPNRTITKMARCRYREVMSFPDFLRTKKHG